MKVAFYLDNRNHVGIDYSQPEKGNPGIGGTQYMFWIISYYLCKNYPDIDLYLFAENTDKMPSEIKTIKVVDIIDAVKLAEEKNIDILVCRGAYFNNNFYDEIEKTNVKCIVWSHNFETYEEAKYISNSTNIKRNVCVGKEQYDRLRDHRIFEKSTYIYNTITLNLYTDIKCEKTKNSVCYIGSLHKGKGFERLAKVWPKIEKKVPDAQLFVLGGGNLYNKKAKMGKYNIAEDKFERNFIKYLIDKDGHIKENVHFMGVVGGKEKLELMKRNCIGVVNPTGIGETFCVGAIEFEALNVPVVTIRKYSLVETVCDKVTGLLFKNDKEFVENIVALLNNKELRENIGKNGNEFVKNKFSLDTIVNEWYNLLLDVYNDVKPNQNLQCENMWNNKKWIREANRRVKKIFPFMPSVLWYESLQGSIKKTTMENIRKFCNRLGKINK